MIIVDSSALIAILLDEPEKQKFEDIIAGGERCVMSAVNPSYSPDRRALLIFFAT
jgi:uncharacterized protein with PIN domain